MTDLVLKNAVIVDVDAERLLPGMDIEITGQAITRIGTAAPLGGEVADGARAVDCSGAYVIPGLADMHVHLEVMGEARLFVANGVTTVRHMDGSPLHLGMEKAFAESAIVAPTVVTTSPIVDGIGPTGFPSVPYAAVAPEPAGADRFVAELAMRGYRQLKVYDRLTPQQHRALCTAAGRHGLLVTGHCPRALTFEAAIAHGQACFEHLTGIARGHLRPAAQGDAPIGGTARILDAARRVNDDSIAALAVLMRERGTWICPTTTVLQPPIPPTEALAPPAADSPTRPTDYLSLAFRQRWRPPDTVVVGGIRLGWREYSDALDEWNATLLDCLRILLSEGVPVLAGTDYPAVGTVPGFALHEELVRLSHLGLTPFQVLRATTGSAARFLGVEGEVGAVAAGQRADLVILQEDPTGDLSALRRPHGVVLRGQYLGRRQLDRLLSDRYRAVWSGAGEARQPVIYAASAHETVGLMERRWGGHVHESGTYQHCLVARKRIVKEHWTTVGQGRARTVELVLAPDGTIEEGQLHTRWGFACSVCVITRDGQDYLVETDHADGVREKVRITGPLRPSERVAWSAFANWLSGMCGDGSDAGQLWDGQDRVGAATMDRAGGRLTIRRPTEVTQLAVKSSSPGNVVVDSASEGGQNTYEHRLILLARKVRQ